MNRSESKQINLAFDPIAIMNRLLKRCFNSMFNFLSRVESAELVDTVLAVT